MDRRACIKLLGTAGLVSLVGQENACGAETDAEADGCGILVDLTACRGCRKCEEVCAYVNKLPAPKKVEAEGNVERKTSDSQWTAVSGHETSRGNVFVKNQCLHCNTPACASACLTKALVKTKEGPVVWRADKCMGCRYCMLSCPFDVPKFEYNSPVPKIQKCRMCWDRVVEGRLPACVEFCPNKVLTFGKRNELLEIARARIYQNPKKYVSHIYGEREAGGTSVLYLSPVPFEELGFLTKVGEKAYPEYTAGFLQSVPVVLTLVPAFLLGLNRVTRNAAHPEQDFVEPSSTER